MKKRNLIYSIATAFLFICSTTHQQTVEKVMDENIDIIQKQYREILKVNTDLSLVPYTLNDDGSLKSVHIKKWTSGFFAASLWYLNALSGDNTWAEQAEKYTEALTANQYITSNHDIGFMVYCPFGNGIKLANKNEYESVIITAANSLLTRFDPDVKAIKSWNLFKPVDGGEYHYPVIIDNMMNLELLYAATKLSGDAKYAEVADIHAQTTLKNHFRNDFSSYHIVCYDSIGNVLAKKTAQGYGHESAWARGQAWALYGYTVCYRETGNVDYLIQAKHVASYVMNHPNLPDDKINLWDFNVGSDTIQGVGKFTDLPEHRYRRDVSSSAIIASALYELSTHVDEGDSYVDFADSILISLSKPVYRATKNEPHFFLLKESVGAITYNSLVGKPLNYADYYLLEAMYRRKNLVKK